jgi:hypothetical protein
MKRSSRYATNQSRRSPGICWYALGCALFALVLTAPAFAGPLDAVPPGSTVPSINGPDADGDQVLDQSVKAVTVPAAIKHGYYLTAANYATNAALTACAKGYHMASVWELLDISTMVYHYKHPYAMLKADSGYGPPSYWNGWVRTGGDASGSSTAGTGNCQAWTSNSGSDYGVAVRLTNTWKVAQGALGFWEATSFNCNIPGPVWCVADKQW